MARLLKESPELTTVIEVWGSLSKEMRVGIANVIGLVSGKYFEDA